MTWHFNSVVFLAMGVFALAMGVFCKEFYTGTIARQSKRRIQTWFGRLWFLGLAAWVLYMAAASWK